ncbi:MAG TPA: hypothetical protein VN634_00975 [Candidatus Limnocylindrales bacterium]|nr:hypothetical protein [Candidatus Limnocylindrales bacterium]
MKTLTSPRTAPDACRVSRVLRCAIVAALATLVPVFSARAQGYPVPESCQVDTGGANDRPGQRDVTEFCVEEADGSPFELYALTNSDEIESGGANTIDICFLLNVDDDAFVNYAVCATLRGDDGGPTFLGMVRLFRCIDTKPDRCMSSVQIFGAHNTACEVRHPDTDPFSPAASNGPGDEYPFDSELLCAIDLDDFGITSSTLRILDSCSFPSMSPNSDPDDCILYSECSRHADCDDGNSCTADQCEVPGICSHKALSGVPCNDGLFCTDGESCNSLGFCGGSEARSCDDTVDCTIDDCDELDDVCVHDARDSLCDDDLSCDGLEICDAANGCIEGSAPDCSDGVACTDDICDEATDSCGHAPVDAACDDGLFCTGAERCDQSDGCIGGAAPQCNDGIACTIDHCDESANACDHAPTDALCDDGLFCDGDEACDPAAGCRAGILRDCNDGVACTLDACDEADDRCVRVAEHGTCDDGSFCNGAEVCGAAGCVSGNPPCAGAAVCDETGNACIGCIADGDCDDGLFCNGNEVCADGACRAGVAIACGDAVACTVDSCNEATNACDHAPSAARCDDGLFCTGSETCDPAIGCETAAAPACNDGIDCTEDWCSEARDECMHSVEDSRCDNGRYCDGRETCDASSGCQEGEPVRCRDDGTVCSVETCSESADGCISDFSRCVCGDREVTGLEECDPPARAGTYEDCNNQLDDDHDGAVDCLDRDCNKGSGRGKVCGEDCRYDQFCERVRSDPAEIQFHGPDAPDMFWVHGRFLLEGTPDPLASGFEIELSNAKQPIYRASLGVGDLDPNATGGGRYSFRDLSARFLGEASSREGLWKVSVEVKPVKGMSYVVFRVRAYGDFSAATLRTMTTQVTVGSEVASLTAEWKALPWRWVLRLRDFEKVH